MSFVINFFVFFSSRRRHTRFSRDWSSDVCSSDLPEATPRLNPPADESAIAELEALVGHELPDAVKAGWRQHDGERCDSYRGVALGFWWLPVAEVAQVWND